MKANRGTAVRSAKAADESGWAPRLAQETRLAELDALLAKASDDSIPIEVERAALLGALNRREVAQQAFVSILRRAPTNFSALNEFGTLLTKQRIVGSGFCGDRPGR